MEFVITDGFVVDALDGTSETADVWIENGRIRKVGKVEILGKKTLDANAKAVLPGIIDAHVHCREPGFEYKENFESAIQAAVAGGVCSLVASTRRPTARKRA